MPHLPGPLEADDSDLTDGTVSTSSTWEPWGTEVLTFNADLNERRVRVLAWLTGNCDDFTGGADAQVRIQTSFDNGTSWRDGTVTQVAASAASDDEAVATTMFASGIVSSSVKVRAQRWSTSTSAPNFRDGHLMAFVLS